MAAAFLCRPLGRKMIQSRALLLIGQAVEKIKERNRIGFFLPLLRSFRLAVIITELLPLHQNSSAIRRFGEGQHIVLRETYPLADFEGDGNAAPLAENTIHLCHR